MRARTLAFMLAIVCWGPTARGGGLGRPTAVSARAFGLGGAFTAIADDATALHHNPAGMARQNGEGGESLLLGVQLLHLPRRYTPILTDQAGASIRGEDQQPTSDSSVLPVIGYVSSPKSRRFALGVGAWMTFGGSVSYEKSAAPALDASTNLVFEVVPGIAYRVNDVLALGAGLRLGVGFLDLVLTKLPVDSEMSAWGVGAGAVLGAMIQPADAVSVGVAWRSPLTVGLTGTAEIEFIEDASPTQTDVEFRQEWPQQVSIGAAWRVGMNRIGAAPLRLAAQVDWTDWSRVDRLALEFPGRDELTQAMQADLEVDWHDSLTFHIGAELWPPTRSGKHLTLRAGYTYDGNAIPDRTLERHTLDLGKHAVALGVGFALGRRLRLDAAVEHMFGAGARLVPDNRKPYEDAGWPDRANRAPGEHLGTVTTVELNLTYLR